MDEQLAGYVKEADRLAAKGLQPANQMATNQLQAAQVYATLAVACAFEKYREEAKGIKK